MTGRENSDALHPPCNPMMEDPTLINRLVREYGELISSRDLPGLLAFPSADAFRKARQRNDLPFPVFCLPGRRGTFARTMDVAHWLQQLGASALATNRISAETERLLALSKSSGSRGEPAMP